MDLVVLLGVVGLLAALVLTWPTFVDDRPYCAGGPGDAQPRLHAECRTGPIPVDWFVPHTWPTIVLVTAIALLILAWFAFRRRHTARDIRRR
jgi:hypothetical protein